tara:strand:- start:2032 stop:2379 length:348 start_codon:yes stop_codon:yes gene_type:complete
MARNNDNRYRPWVINRKNKKLVKSSLNIKNSDTLNNELNYLKYQETLTDRSTNSNIFKTKDNINAEISENSGKLKNKRTPEKIYGARFSPPEPVALGTEGLDIIGTESGNGLGVT